MKAVSLVAVGLASLLTFSACSSSDPKSGTADSGDSVSTDVSLPAGVTAPDGTAAPVVVSKECDVFILAKKTALAGVRSTMGKLPDEYSALAASYVALAAKAPSDLQADLTTVSKTYAALAKLATKANGDIVAFSKDAEALKQIGDPGFQASISKVTIYTNITCPES